MSGTERWGKSCSKLCMWSAVTLMMLERAYNTPVSYPELGIPPPLPLTPGCLVIRLGFLMFLLHDSSCFHHVVLSVVSLHPSVFNSLRPRISYLHVSLSYSYWLTNHPCIPITLKSRLYIYQSINLFRFHPSSSLLLSFSKITRLGGT